MPKITIPNNYPIGVTINAEAYGKIIDDCDDGKEFVVEELLLWVGKSSVKIPMSVIDEAPPEIREALTKAAVKLAEEESEVF